MKARQYAYRKGRTVERHLIELSDFVLEKRGAGNHIYVSSTDAEGVFDTVPHEQVLETLRE